MMSWQVRVEVLALDRCFPLGLFRFSNSGIPFPTFVLKHQSLDGNTIFIGIQSRQCLILGNPASIYEISHYYSTL